MATQDAGVSSPNGSDQPSAAPSADGSRCCTPDPNRRPERSLNAR